METSDLAERCWLCSYFCGPCHLGMRGEGEDTGSGEI